MENELSRLAQLNQKDPKAKLYTTRPARKQVDKPYVKHFAYQQGDDEYNIWYDKYLHDRPVREREHAKTRCDPQQDCGLTKADLLEPETSFLCLHFIRGCCVEGGSWRYLHHLPTRAEKQRLDSVRDIFGRTKHNSHRDDFAGIGNFQKESRTLFVEGIVLPPTENPVEDTRQMLTKHFSMWGKVQELTFIPPKCVAFVRYGHRSDAEVAKEAMNNQSLDYDEILLIRWANDDTDTSLEHPYSEAWHKAQLNPPAAKSKPSEDVERIVKPAKKKKEKRLPEPVNADEIEEQNRHAKLVKAQASRMQEVLNRIEQASSFAVEIPAPVKKRKQ